VAAPPLEAEGLRKSLGGRLVVSDVSFSLAPGEVFGFLGPNGAGKTTTIRLLTGLARPDAGTVRVGGTDLHEDFEEAMRGVGALVETPDLYPYLTGRENLEHFGRMIGGVDGSRIEAVADLVQLGHRLDDRLAIYSLGMRQRLGLAQALLGEPRVLILDEPANGLDPAGIREIRELIRALARDRGLAIFVSSHLLAEVRLMCDRVAIIHRGRILAVEAIDELLRRGTGRVRFRVRPQGLAAEVLGRRRSSAPPDLLDEGWIAASVEPGDVPQVLQTLVDSGVDVFAVEPEMRTLEDLFLEMTGGETV
jgi:ABC-2 type transport system ATP-binding protein